MIYENIKNGLEHFQVCYSPPPPASRRTRALSRGARLWRAASTSGPTFFFDSNHPLPAVYGFGESALVQPNRIDNTLELRLEKGAVRFGGNHHRVEQPVGLIHGYEPD